MRPRCVLIIIVGVLVVAVTAVVTALTLRGDPVSDHPPRLALAGEPVHTRPKVTPTPSSKAGTWRVTLAGSLPSGGPDHGPVWALPGGAVDAARKRALAAALGLGEPVRMEGAWEVRGRGVLQVRDGPGQPWTFNAEYAPGPAPTERDIHLADTAVLNATGVTGTTGPIIRSGPYLTLATEPAVGGLPTAGWATQVTVGPGGRLTAAHGWLAKPQRGADYPLISASKAFDELRRTFGHLPGPIEAAGPRVCPQVEAEGSLPCTPKASVVTGARPGLSLTFDRDAPLLAPSWLFTTTAPGQPIPQVAIAPDHLVTPGP